MMGWMVYMICAPSLRIKTPVETTHALSLPGVMAHLLWAAFPKKIISRKGAEAQRGGQHFRKKTTVRVSADYWFRREYGLGWLGWYL